jgi:hypothetical protein
VILPPSAFSMASAFSCSLISLLVNIFLSSSFWVI